MSFDPILDTCSGSLYCLCSTFPSLRPVKDSSYLILDAKNMNPHERNITPMTRHNARRLLLIPGSYPILFHQISKRVQFIMFHLSCFKRVSHVYLNKKVFKLYNMTKMFMFDEEINGIASRDMKQ